MIQVKKKIGWSQWSECVVTIFRFPKNFESKALHRKVTKMLRFMCWCFGTENLLINYWCWNWKIFTKLALANGIHWPIIWSRQDSLLLIHIIIGDFRWMTETSNFKCWWISMTFTKFRCDWGIDCILRCNELWNYYYCYSFYFFKCLIKIQIHKH